MICIADDLDSNRDVLMAENKDRLQTGAAEDSMPPCWIVWNSLGTHRLHDRGDCGRLQVWQIPRRDLRYELSPKRYSGRTYAVPLGVVGIIR
ncbi:hypothetical protein, partial [endosymbiont of Lamellibrachia barhami]|uniref:hypothetical protein n=1 Tax=endosymbiont of Lamellibrachia barhami TaxID=205975 RepID=UPI00272C4337